MSQDQRNGVGVHGESDPDASKEPNSIGTAGIRRRPGTRQRASQTASLDLAAARPEEDASTAGTAPTSRSLPSPSEDQLISGTLVAHGRAAYRFNLRGEPSYFVRIHSGDGQRTIWDRGLERAIEQSLTKPLVRDEIGLRRLRSDSRGIKAPEPAAKSPVPKEQGPATRQHYWLVEKKSFFKERARAAQTLRDVAIAPREGVQRHSELVSSYLLLRAAELTARALRDPEDRKKFVEGVRLKLAESIERGEPWPQVRLRERRGGPADLERGHPPAAMTR
jgi:hypothetical protein